MSKLPIKETDNSYFEEKVMIRLHSLRNFNADSLNVLEAFAGDGLIWEEVRSNFDRKVSILKIDIKEKAGVYLKGDNLKYLTSIDLSKFHLIDLDAYGSPYPQLKVLFNREYKGIVHCTFIQSGMGKLNDEMLINIGYSHSMIKKVPTMFNRDGLEKFCQYLSMNGVKEIFGYFLHRKNYFYFYLDN